MTIYYSPNNNSFYDTRIRYSSIPGDVLDVTDIAAQMRYEINTNNKIVVVTNGEISYQERVNTLTWDDIRYQRDLLLDSSDWTQMPDYNGANKANWAAYRQELRDLPQTYANPNDVVWPTVPS